MFGSPGVRGRSPRGGARPGHLERRPASRLPSAEPPTHRTGERLIPAPAADALAILGKSQGTKPENLQLHARVGFAAALWHSRGGPRPLVFYVPADFGGPDRAPDAGTVRRLLTERYRIPESSIVTRRISNCTHREVRGLRDLCAETGVERLTAVTHAYHAARTARYLEEVLPGRTRVAAVTPSALAALPIPPAVRELFADLPDGVSRSLPRGPEALREALVETAMTVLHAIDRSGRVECRLADLLRHPPPAVRGGGDGP